LEELTYSEDDLDFIWQEPQEVDGGWQVKQFNRLHNVFHDFRLRIGTTKEAETDDSGLVTVYEYINALSLGGPQFVFAPGETAKIFIQSIDVDQNKALNDFNAGLWKKHWSLNKRQLIVLALIDEDPYEVVESHDAVWSNRWQNTGVVSIFGELATYLQEKQLDFRHKWSLP